MSALGPPFVLTVHAPGMRASGVLDAAGNVKSDFGLSPCTFPIQLHFPAQRIEHLGMASESYL